MASFIESIDQVSNNPFPCSRLPQIYVSHLCLVQKQLQSCDASKASATQNQKSNISFWLISQDSWLLPLYITLLGKQAALNHRLDMHSKLFPQERKHSDVKSWVWMNFYSLHRLLSGFTAKGNEPLLLQFLQAALWLFSKVCSEKQLAI